MRATGIDILATLLSHGHPMTAAGLTGELSDSNASITRALGRLISRGLVEKAGSRVNPGTKRPAMLFAPGPLIRLYAMQQKPRADE